MHIKKRVVFVAVLAAVLLGALVQARPVEEDGQRSIATSAADLGRWNFVKRVAAKTVSRFNFRENPQRYLKPDPEFADCVPSRTILYRILFDFIVTDVLFQKKNYADSGIPYIDSLEWIIPEALAQARAMAGATDKTQATGASGIRLTQKLISKAGDFDHSMLKKIGAVLLASLKTDVCSAHKRDTVKKVRDIKTAQAAARETFDLKLGISKYLARWVKKAVIKKLITQELKKNSNGEQISESLSTIIARYALKPVLYVALAQAEKAVLG